MEEVEGVDFCRMVLFAQVSKQDILLRERAVCQDLQWRQPMPEFKLLRRLIFHIIRKAPKLLRDLYYQPPTFKQRVFIQLDARPDIRRFPIRGLIGVILLLRIIRPTGLDRFDFAGFEEVVQERVVQLEAQGRKGFEQILVYVLDFGLRNFPIPQTFGNKLQDLEHRKPLGLAHEV